MNILYLSCHSVLEYLETKLLTEIGHNVFSFGSYVNPAQPHDIKRPGFDGAYNDHLLSVVIQCSKENLHQELIDWADAIIVMHRADWISYNWHKMKNKKVIWRTIGQSVKDVEGSLALFRTEGLKIVRYSPEENRIPGYIGEDAIIRFYQDDNEFKGWIGNETKVITVVQSMKKRGAFCGYDIFDNVTNGLPRVVYGPDNVDIECNGGQLTYDQLKHQLRKNRVYFYTGTYPASYTLAFIEAFMTGIPIVAIGESLYNLGYYENHLMYEVHKIIKNGVNGYVSDNLDELKKYINMLLNDHELARKIGEEGRKTAIELFGINTIKKQWTDFLNNL